MKTNKLWSQMRIHGLILLLFYDIIQFQLFPR